MRNFTLSRRAVLRGTTACLALPFLEAMLPRRVAAQAAGTRPLRFIVWTFPDGVRMDAWTPKQTGAAYALTPILQPLAAYQENFNVISGLANTPASVVSGDVFAGSHARATGAMLTQMPLTFTSGSNIKNGVSVDQVVANLLKTQVPGLKLPSLELGAVYAGATGNCEDGYSCAYLTNLAWSGPTTFLPKETNPKAVFDRLTQGGLPTPAGMSTSASPPSAAMPDTTSLYQKSILDVVSHDVGELMGRLGKSDRDKLSDYLDSVNELERRIAALTPGVATPGSSAMTSTPVAAAGCQAIAAPSDGTYLGRDRGKNTYSYADLIRVMNDLMVFALQCDLTRVITFMSEIPLNTQTNFAFVGVDSSNYHDEITHHGGNPEKLAGIQKVNTWYAEQFAYLLGKLSAIQDPAGGTLLDNSVIMFTSEFGDGDNHYHYDLPVLVAGSAAGRWKAGRHIAYPSTPDRGAGAIETARRGDMPLANLYLSLLQAFGMDVSTVGSVDGTTPYGTKPLAELTMG
jgi:hypothetical protein